MKYLIPIILISAILNVYILTQLDAYKKFKPIKEALEETHSEGKCLDWSKELVGNLEKKGIQAEVVIGESPETAKQEDIKHAWVGIWIEPQTGQFTQEYYK